MSAELLERAIALAQGGKQEEARELLVQLIAADMHNEIAWLWYASTLATREDMAKAFEECLHHNPHCAEAEERLGILKAHQAAPTQKTSQGARTAEAVTSKRRICPYCAELVNAEADVCRYCGNDITRQPVTAAEIPQEEKRGLSMVWLLLPAVGLLAAFCLFGLSVALILESSPSGGSSIVDLDAEISFRDGLFYVSNNDKFDWVECRIELNDDYSLRVGRINAESVFVVGSMRFTKKDGTRFNPFTSKPLGMFIWCKTPQGASASYYGTWK